MPQTHPFLVFTLICEVMHVTDSHDNVLRVAKEM